MDRSKLDAANELAAQIDHYKWVEIEVTIKRNKGITPIRIATGIDLATVAVLSDEDTKEVSVLVTDFLNGKIKKLEEQFKAL